MADQSDREQRTEEATPRRRSEARERGQVALSTDLIAAVGLTVGAGATVLGGPGLTSTIAERIQQGLSSLSLGAGADFDVPRSTAFIEASLSGVMAAVCAIVVPTVLLSAVAGYVQIGFMLSPKAIEVDPGKLDPIKGISKLFSLRGVARTLLSMAKVLLIVAVASTVAWLHVDDVVHAGLNELGPLLGAIGVVILRTGVSVLIVVVALAILDVLFQRFQHDRDLRMTRQEIKEEHRLTEGDPKVRARIRSVQRELAMRRMMSDVPDATVVVTNPTHYAVALRYERAGPDSVGQAPVVVAKGVDHLAARIREIAREHGVVCHEDPPLARALHARVAIGQEIPEELYSAVAAVLATVYRLQEGQPA